MLKLNAPLLKCKTGAPIYFFFHLFAFLSILQLGIAAPLPVEVATDLKPSLREADGSIVECHLDSELRMDVEALDNWGENVHFSPKYIFIPKTKTGICNIVKWAGEQDLRVRVSGYRHTWNPVYPDDGQILISMLGLEYVNSNKASYVVHGKTGAGPEFRTIAFTPGATEPDKILCRIGGAVTNDELRDFCVNTPDPFSHRLWTIPLNVILVENTFSGTISSMCHGAGCNHKTLSDLVEEIEFINAKGEIQIINKADSPELMKAAAGSFGLLGVITSITLKLDEMGYALADPKFVKLAQAIPPPFGTRLEDMPAKLKKDLRISSQESLDAIIAQNSDAFFERCKDYYAEWFWFILTDKCWINTWNKDDPQNDAKNRQHWESFGEKLHRHFESWLQTSMSTIAGVFNTEKHTMPPSPFQESFVRYANDVTIELLCSHKHTMPVSEALHFQQGIRHIRVRDVEMEIPIPAKADGQPDWTICQRAWWDAIYTIYRHLEETGTLPINLTLEMRIMGGSDVTMAAQRNNAYTCSIEVLSNMFVPHNTWKAFTEQIVAHWVGYTDYRNNPLDVRTHWAKEWYGLQMNGMDGLSFVKQTYREAIPEFRQQLSHIATVGGYTLEDMQKRFSNHLFDTLIFQEP